MKSKYSTFDAPKTQESYFFNYRLLPISFKRRSRIFVLRYASKKTTITIIVIVQTSLTSHKAVMAKNTYLVLKIEMHSVCAVGHLVLCHPLRPVLPALCSYLSHFDHYSKIHLNPLRFVACL